MQQPTSVPTSLSPDQIRRRIVDYDSQVRQGIEDGNIQQVMKRLGPLLVSLVFFSYCIDNSYTIREQYSGIRRVPQLNGQRFHAPCSSTTSSGPGTRPNFDRHPILLTSNWTKCKRSMNDKGRRQQPPLPHPLHPLPSPNPPPSLLDHLSPKRKRRDERPVPRRRPSLSPSPWQDLHDRQGPGLSLRRWRW